MLRNGKFRFYAGLFCLSGVLYTFLCAGLLGGLPDILGRLITEQGGGWSGRMLRLPVIAGSILGVPLLALCGRLYRVWSVRETFLPCVLLTAMGCAGLAAANGLDIYGGAASGLYWLFFPAMLLIRCGALCTLLGVFTLASSWFIRCRGRVMAVIAMGIPLFYALGVERIAGSIQTRLGGDWRPLCLGLAALLALLALLTRFWMRDWPEQTGLYPDGADREPASEPETEPPALTLKEMFTDRRCWLILASYGPLWALSILCLRDAEPRLLAQSGLLALPAALLLGALDDRYGSPAASFAVYAAALLSGAALWAGGALRPLLTVGLACLLGGGPALSCCVIAHAYGRRGYPTAGPVLCALLTAAAILLLTLAGLGKFGTVFTALTALAGLYITLCLRNIDDANASDRGRK